MFPKAFLKIILSKTILKAKRGPILFKSDLGLRCLLVVRGEAPADGLRGLAPVSLEVVRVVAELLDQGASAHHNLHAILAGCHRAVARHAQKDDELALCEGLATAAQPANHASETPLLGVVAVGQLDRFDQTLTERLFGNMLNVF